MGDAGAEGSGVGWLEAVRPSESGKLAGLVSDPGAGRGRGVSGASSSLLMDPRLLPTEPIFADSPVPDELPWPSHSIGTIRTAACGAT